VEEGWASNLDLYFFEAVMGRNSLRILVKLVATEKNLHQLISQVAADVSLLNTVRRFYLNEGGGSGSSADSLGQLCKSYDILPEVFRQRLHVVANTLNLIEQEEDYYETLGVDRGASIEEIKAAFRRQIFACHPDRNPDDPQAAERFRKLHRAYQVLSRVESKQNYDQNLTVPAWIETPIVEDEEPPVSPWDWKKLRRTWPIGLFVLVLLVMCFFVDFQNWQTARYYETRKENPPLLDEFAFSHPEMGEWNETLHECASKMGKFSAHSNLVTSPTPVFLFAYLQQVVQDLAIDKGPRIRKPHRKEPETGGLARENAPPPPEMRVAHSSAKPKDEEGMKKDIDPLKELHPQNLKPKSSESLAMADVPAGKPAVEKAPVPKDKPTAVEPGPSGPEKGVRNVAAAAKSAQSGKKESSVIVAEVPKVETPKVERPKASARALPEGDSEKGKPGKNESKEDLPRGKAGRFADAGGGPKRVQEEIKPAKESSRTEPQELPRMVSIDEMSRGLQEFLNRYADAYERKNTKAFFSLFDPHAVENGEPIETLQPVYCENFKKAEQIQYSIKLVRWSAAHESVNLSARFRLAVKLSGESPSESMGEMTMTLARRGEEFRVKRLDYSFH
jgi:hypothetical protein